MPIYMLLGSIDNHENIKENGFIQLNNFYLEDSNMSNVQTITPKTGEYGNV